MISGICLRNTAVHRYLTGSSSLTLTALISVSVVLAKHYCEAFNDHLDIVLWTQIVRHDRTMEQIVFPIPEICEYLTEETKSRVYNTAERDDQGSKVSDFFEKTEDMFAEMKWQKKLRGTVKLLP